MKRKNKKLWNLHYRNSSPGSVKHDNWLKKHSELFHENEYILEAGCGFARNSHYLLSQGHKVISSDFSRTVLGKLRSLYPELVPEKINLKRRIKYPCNTFDSIIADLCIHYFSRKTTLRILNNFSRILKPGGKFFCRVNSIYDENFGYGKGKEIEKNYFCNNGNFKRFFSEEDIKYYFSGWDMISVENYEIRRYIKPKNVFEIVCRKKLVQS